MEVLLIEEKKGEILISFDDFFNMRKKQISKMCLEFDKITDYRIEYEDLFQEASLKLFEIYKNNKPLDINFSLKIVRDNLINYIKKNKVKLN